MTFYSNRDSFYLIFDLKIFTRIIDSHAYTIIISTAYNFSRPSSIDLFIQLIISLDELILKNVVFYRLLNLFSHIHIVWQSFIFSHLV